MRSVLCAMLSAHILPSLNTHTHHSAQTQRSRLWKHDSRLETSERASKPASRTGQTIGAPQWPEEQIVVVVVVVVVY